MIPLARRILAIDRAYSLAIVLGIAAIVVLNLFVIAIYDGARFGATAYVRERPVDLWVSRKGATDLKLSLSYYNTHWEDTVAATPGVESVASLLRTVGAAQFGDERVGLFVFGFDPSQILARPRIVDGSASIDDGDIILDSGFAAKYHLSVGDSVQLQNGMFAVRGLSGGTNNLVMQMAFVTYADAERLMQFFGIFSYTMVRLQPEAQPAEVIDRLAKRLPDHAVIPQKTFVQSNLAVVEQGTLPILLLINAIGATAGGLLLALMLFALMTDRREEFAVLKAIGTGQAFLTRLVLRQSLALVSVGYLVGLASFFLFRPALFNAVPTLSMTLRPVAALLVLAASLLLGLLGAWLPVSRLRSVYPTEAFR